MLLANLPWTAHYYHEFLETGLTLSVHSPSGSVNWIFPEGMTVEKWINDGLMVIFFFIVGLEIKRELLCGHLSSFRRAISSGAGRDGRYADARADLSGVQCRHSSEYGLGDSDCDRYRFRGGNSLDAG